MTNQISETFEQLKNGSQNGHGNVFVKPDGTPHRGWLRRPLWRIIKETGVKPFTLHDLRHTFASQLSDVRSGSTDCPKAHGAQQHRCNNDLCAPFARPLKSAIERLGTRFQ